MAAEPVAVPTPDGVCRATLHLPDAPGPRPAVILYPDAGGVRDAFHGMAGHLAGLGYVTLLPDVYYRAGDWEPFDPATAFSDPAERARMMGLARSLTAELSVRDARAFLDFLAGRAEVAAGPVGTTGYCMGGRIALTVAGHHGERIGAAASFHGGRLAVPDDPESPHHLAGGVTATVLVAGAHDDALFPPDQAERLAAAYTAAGVRHTIETYPAAHGFAVPDNPTFDAGAADRHWRALAGLYAATL
jgi:carboxymethylenebutenolidase